MGAVKGNIIKMELGTGAAAGIANQYRVLEANGDVVKVVALYDVNVSTPFNSKTLTTNIGALTVQKYNGSSIDILLNEKFYNSLLDEARAAIVPTDITQDIWFWGIPANQKRYKLKTYKGVYGKKVKDEEAETYYYSVSQNLDTSSEEYPPYEEDCGEKYVYALGIQDIIDYLGVTTTMEEENTTLTNKNIWKMLWNLEPTKEEAITEDNITFPWLRSGYIGYSEYIWRLGSLDGFITYGFHDYEGRSARPVFTIDLSKLSEIEWEIVE